MSPHKAEDGADSRDRRLGQCRSCNLHRPQVILHTINETALGSAGPIPVGKRLRLIDSRDREHQNDRHHHDQAGIDNHPYHWGSP
jgi:hypothetical protein